MFKLDIEVFQATLELKIKLVWALFDYFYIFIYIYIFYIYIFSILCFELERLEFRA